MLYVPLLCRFIHNHVAINTDTVSLENHLFTMVHYIVFPLFCPMKALGNMCYTCSNSMILFQTSKSFSRM